MVLNRNNTNWKKMKNTDLTDYYSVSLFSSWVVDLKSYLDEVNDWDGGTKKQAVTL